MIKNLLSGKLIRTFHKMIFHVENHSSEIGRAVGGSRGACVFGNVSWKVNSNLYFQDVWRVSGHQGQRLGGPGPHGVVSL